MYKIVYAKNPHSTQKENTYTPTLAYSHLEWYSIHTCYISLICYVLNYESAHEYN